MRRIAEPDARGITAEPPKSAEAHRPLRVASYNIHSCRGLRGNCSPERIVAVIEELDADIVALQEIEAHRRRSQEHNQFDYFNELPGWHFTPGITIMEVMRGERDGHYGNGLLSRVKPRAVRRHDLSVPDLEPRGVIDADFGVTFEQEAGPVSGTLRVIATHLSLTRAARQWQVYRLADLLHEKAERRRSLILGDLNEWNPFSETLRPLGRDRSPVSFPAWLPILRLDRIIGANDVRTHRSRLARHASDHLPIVATVPGVTLTDRS